MLRIMFGMRRLAALAGISLLAAGSLSAQGSTAISGRITSRDGNPLPGAQIVVTNTSTGAQTGAIANADGQYTVPGLRGGTVYRLEVRLIGYGTERVEEFRVTAGETRRFDFSLGSQAIAVDAIEVFSERAVERRTPVAYTDIDKAQMERQLASRDLPMVLNTTPSVYATMQGGGAGDARVNVRGFTQRNIGVMINGVPVNDMENGWVYWSNWDGVGDATSSIQLQRGLSAVNLATPSIGGTLNVITDPAAMGRRLNIKQEFGNDGFLKTTAMLSTGLLNERFALAVSGVRKTGDGLVEGTWTDAWAYYVASSFVLNSKNRFDLFALGAPQMHGQNSFR
ncbi:MAG TPA: TonB-dependent receptor, partial [Pseudolabrys sp.]|nr:TonB-dependent receptor [Pseudolabrys sp.]